MKTRNAAVAALMAGACLSGCAVTTSGTATPAASPRLSTAADLPAALLAAPDVGSLLGGQPVVVTSAVTQPWDDAIFVAGGGDPRCLAMVGAAQQQAYSGAGVTAMRGQVLREPPAAGSLTHFATQAVVLFDSEAAASDFFERSRDQWDSCANAEMRYPELGAADQVWSVGAATAQRETLTVSRSQLRPQQWSCQRALTVRSNVAVDVEACDLTGPTDAAAAMAGAIVDRLPAP